MKCLGNSFDNFSISGHSISGDIYFRFTCGEEKLMQKGKKSQYILSRVVASSKLNSIQISSFTKYIASVLLFSILVSIIFLIQHKLFVKERYINISNTGNNIFFVKYYIKLKVKMFFHTNLVIDSDGVFFTPGFYGLCVSQPYFIVFC